MARKTMIFYTGRLPVDLGSSFKFLAEHMHNSQYGVTVYRYDEADTLYNFIMVHDSTELKDIGLTHMQLADTDFVARLMVFTQRYLLHAVPLKTTPSFLEGKGVFKSISALNVSEVLKSDFLADLHQVFFPNPE